MGCSFVLVREPNEAARKDPNVALDCTTSRAMPLTDLLIGAALGALVVGATYSAVQDFNEDCTPGQDCYSATKPALLGAFLVVSPWWISSAVGLSDTGECRRLHRARGASS
jgi:hypothetical protein